MKYNRTLTGRSAADAKMRRPEIIGAAGTVN